MAASKHPADMDKREAAAVIPGDIASRLRWVRGQRALLDSDLAATYGLTTTAFNQAVRRNLDRFAADFLLQRTVAKARS